MPRISSEKNSPYRSGRMTPIVWVLLVDRLRAPECGTYCSASTASITFLRVASVTGPAPVRTRDTEATDTFARSATSRIVAGFTGGRPCASS